MKTNKTEKSKFLDYLLSCYGSFLDMEKKKIWIRDCGEVLEDEIDYIKLRLHFLHYFDTKNLNNIPSPQWLYQESRQFLIEKKTQAEITKERLEREKALPSEPPPPEFKAMVEKLLQKNKERMKGLYL